MRTCNPLNTVVCCIRAQLTQRPFAEQDFIGLATEGLCLNAGATAQGMEIFMVSHSHYYYIYIYSIHSIVTEDPEHKYKALSCVCVAYIKACLCSAITEFNFVQLAVL
jgi:hypothetical protein